MVFATFVGVLLAGAPGWAKTYKFCQGGGVVESGSPLGKKLYAKPSADALGVFGKVKDPVNCSFAKDPATNLTDYTQPEACAEICAERRATLGDLVSCINDSVESSLAMSANAYRQFAAGSAGLPIVFLMPSGPQPDVTQILRSPPAKRSLLQVSFGSKPGDDVAIDVSSPKWDVKWGEVVSKAATACSTAPPAKPARNCAKLGEAANRFAAKLKLLERSAALQELLQAEAGGDAAGVTVCDPDDPTGAKAAAARKKAGEDRKNLTANAKLLVLAKRPGKLDPYLQDCQNLKLGSIDTSCAELGRLGLEPFAGQLHRILGSPGVLVNYVDLLRIRAINELMKTHRSVVGAPLKGLPAGCDRFKSGILAAETRLTAEEKKNFDERGSPEELGKLRAEAVKVAELVRMQDKESRVPSKNCHHDGQALECVLNPDYDAAQARMRAYQARIRRELELHPLLSARDAAPRDDWDLPAVKAFVEAKPEGLAAVATDARAKISAAIAKNVAKACNDANDRGGWGQSSDSVSWIDLVRLPGLTSTTVSTPPFGVFGGLQECLKRKADEIVSAREDATMLVTVGCIAGTMMSGPFVGVPCAGIMMGMAYSEYKLADNRMRWVKECEELTANGDKALCSSQEYLDSRARYESAIEALVLNGAFAGFEAGSVLVKGAKLLRAAQLARRAQQLEEAGVELGKLELVAADVKADLADPEATVNALGEKNADPTKVHGRGNVRVAGPEVAGAADG
ncbi:MAG: hypothetical protein HY075_06200, partial [Deltaproteobacteria bacterium]|nr:hypothetical protein [Deltaproteobacteria bacterium]